MGGQDLDEFFAHRRRVVLDRFAEEDAKREALQEAADRLGDDYEAIDHYRELGRLGLE